MLIGVSGLKVGTMIGGKDDYCIIVKSLFFQAIYKSPEIFIKTCALTEVIRIFFGSISLLRAIVRTASQIWLFSSLISMTGKNHFS